MKFLFLWFYCLPLSRAAIFPLLAAALFLLLRACFGTRKFWRPAVLLLFAGWMLVILLGTLGRRGGACPAPILTPFHSYYAALALGERELLRECFMNAVLFYPAGLLAWELLPQSWPVSKRLLLTAAAFAALSAGIEVCQYLLSLGQAETDDVIHNTLGAALGALTGALPRTKRR